MVAGMSDGSDTSVPTSMFAALRRELVRLFESPPLNAEQREKLRLVREAIHARDREEAAQIQVFKLANEEIAKREAQWKSSPWAPTRLSDRSHEARVLTDEINQLVEVISASEQYLWQNSAGSRRLKELTGKPRRLTKLQIEGDHPSGRLVFGIFAALAEFERELIRERTIAGLSWRVPVVATAAVPTR